jgi:hypothetical protein
MIRHAAIQGPVMTQGPVIQRPATQHHASRDHASRDHASRDHASRDHGSSRGGVRPEAPRSPTCVTCVTCQHPGHLPQSHRRRSRFPRCLPCRPASRPPPRQRHRTRRWRLSPSGYVNCRRWRPARRHPPSRAGPVRRLVGRHAVATPPVGRLSPSAHRTHEPQQTFPIWVQFPGLPGRMTLGATAGQPIPGRPPSATTLHATSPSPTARRYLGAGPGTTSAAATRQVRITG